MSTEEGDAGPACGEAAGAPAAKQRLTWEESDPLGSQGRRQPDGEEEPQPGEEEDEEDEEEEAEGRARAADSEKISGEENGGNTSSEEGAVGGRCGKTQAMPSTCSSETCIPTPSCRICFQGAEQMDRRGRAGTNGRQSRLKPETLQACDSSGLMRDDSSLPELKGSRRAAANA